MFIFRLLNVQYSHVNLTVFFSGCQVRIPPQSFRSKSQQMFQSPSSPLSSAWRIYSWWMQMLSMKKHSINKSKPGTWNLVFEHSTGGNIWEFIMATCFPVAIQGPDHKILSVGRWNGTPSKQRLFIVVSLLLARQLDNCSIILSCSSWDKIS